jgi:acetyl-CoA carboxylase biotin carboxylase subunit
MSGASAPHAAITRVLVANRGEIALRIIRTCRELGIETVLAVSQADRDSVPARMADRAVCVGPARSSESYLNIGALVTAARLTGCQAVHPGYGFLAENAEFATACETAGLRFVGPPPRLLSLFGDKLAAKALAQRAGVPTAAGLGPVEDLDDALRQAADEMFPMLIKPVHGGGGKGMRVVADRSELADAFALSSREAKAAFGDGSLYLERWIRRARHVEVQVAGNGRGDVTHFGDRDCTVQRRHQKLIEEAPAPALDDDVRERIHAAAAALCRECRYESLGTVEFVVDQDTGEFFFLEVNARIQVEHGVTEQVTGRDLVALQLQLCGDPATLPDQSEVRFDGCAVELRVNAEDPEHDFRPSPGRITAWSVPSGEGIRVDTHCVAGYVVPPFYDSLVAKVMAHASTREAAIDLLVDALEGVQVEGILTTIPLGLKVLRSNEFKEPSVTTRWLDSWLARVPA